jgi:hypothetical protein
MMNEQHNTTPERRSVKLVTERKPLQLGPLTLECAVGQTEDGNYVDLLSGRKLEQQLGEKSHTHGLSIVQTASSTDNTEKVYIPRFLAAQNLRDFATPEMTQYFLPYTYKVHGMTAYGYDVDILRAICVLYSRAWRAGVLTPQQMRTANEALDIQEALAGVGLHALVQEAVGWHRGDLQNLFNRYLVEVPEAWRKLFHRAYCELAFALHGRHFSHQHPRWFMGFVRRSVYDWIPLALNDELDVRNPIIDTQWRRRVKKHQLLSPNEGRKLLTDQISLVMIAGKKTRKYAKRFGKSLPMCRAYFWQELRDICEEEHVVQAAWDDALSRGDDAGVAGLPLFQ